MARFEYFQDPFAQEADQRGPRVDRDRTRRALYDGLFIFLLRPYHHRENPKLLQKDAKKTGKNLFFSRKTLADSPRKRTKSGPR
jgi:hypothetical protein